MGKEYRRDIDIKSNVVDYETILLFDSFEAATVWGTGGTAASCTLTRVTTEYQTDGIYVGKLLNTSNPLVNDTTIEAFRYFAYPGAKSIFCSFHASHLGSEGNGRYGLIISVTDLSYDYTFGIAYDWLNERVMYLNSAGVWTNTEAFSVKCPEGTPNLFKFSANLSTLKYGILRANAYSFNAAALSIQRAATSSSMQSFITLQATQLYTDGESASGALYDAILISQS